MRSSGDCSCFSLLCFNIYATHMDDLGGIVDVLFGLNSVVLFTVIVIEYKH